tara:strand:+ start:842 stop:1291 length:450 start_codon:yes stop_codon:yes gene_type:complete
MAYVLFNTENNLAFYAANDEEKNNLISPSVNNAQTVSDQNFLKLKQNIATASLVDGNLVITEIDQSIVDDIQPSDPLQGIKFWHNSLKEKIKIFLELYNSSQPMYSQAQNYLNTLENINYDTLSIAPNKTWETYCEENSISYLNPLQLP